MNADAVIVLAMLVVIYTVLGVLGARRHHRHQRQRHVEALERWYDRTYGGGDW